VLSAAGRLIWLREAGRPTPNRPRRPTREAPHRHRPRPRQLQLPGNRPRGPHDITAHLPAGAVIAIVGENGSGKTTLVKLLAALYRPTAGTIRADDTDLTTIDPTEWQQRISPACQDFVRFEFTVGESVGVGELPRVDDEPAITAALTGQARQTSSKPASPANSAPHGRYRAQRRPMAETRTRPRPHA